MFFSIPNLRSSTVTEVEEPWLLKTKTPPPYAEGKEAVIEFCNRINTEHAMLSMVEGLTAEVRVTMEDNAPFKLHGLLVDYDNPLPANAVEYIKEHKPAEFMPTYLVVTASGNGRLVWEFEKPILFSNKNHMKEFIKLLARHLKLNKWLGGLDTEALTNWVKYYELGQSWTVIDALSVIPISHLELWFFQSATDQKFDDTKTVTYKIPAEDLAREVDERYPGRWQGPFVYGARGIRFWDATADNTTAAVVTPDGMLCYTGNQHFVPWKQLFGSSFVEQYEADAISDIVHNSAYDGDKFWLQQDNGVWGSWSKEDFGQELRVRGKDPKRKPGQTASEIDVIENHIKRHCKVNAALPFLYFPSGVIHHDGHPFLNTSQVKTMSPGAPLTEGLMTFTDGRKHFPLIYRLLRNMFIEAEEGAPDQLTYFLAWLKYAYVNAYERTPKPGQAVVIAGPPGKGKTFLSWKIISGLMGGRSDASAHLVENDRWTERLLEHPIMTIDDSSALSDAKSLREFTNKIKRYTANPEIMYEQKYMKTGAVPWLGRIVITCNLDAESLRILPDMDSSTQDKICLFKASDPIIDFADFQTNDKTIKQELPAFARFLIDWPYPEECMAGEKRFGVRAFHHPDLFEESRQHGLGMLHEMLQGFLTNFFSMKTNEDRVEWTGTALQLLADINAQFPAMSHELNYRTLSIQLGKLAKANFNLSKEWKADAQQYLWHINKTLIGATSDYLGENQHGTDKKVLPAMRDEASSEGADADDGSDLGS